MKVTWLAHSGLLFENANIKILVDPYLSDSLGKENKKFTRRVGVDTSYLSCDPDVILITHQHPDHLDTQTLRAVFENSTHPITVLAPYSAYNTLVSLGGEHNYVMLNPHSVWGERGVTFYSVHAEHTDRYAAGFIIDDGKSTYYVSGDTLYNYDVIDDVTELAPDGVDVAFLPIEGRGNKMNARDAADFAYEIGAKSAVPVHWGLFDDIDPSEFDFEDAVILRPYEAKEL